MLTPAELLEIDKRIGARADRLIADHMTGGGMPQSLLRSLYLRPATEVGSPK